MPEAAIRQSQNTLPAGCSDLRIAPQVVRRGRVFRKDSARPSLQHGGARKRSPTEHTNTNSDGGCFGAAPCERLIPEQICQAQTNLNHQNWTKSALFVRERGTNTGQSHECGLFHRLLLHIYIKGIRYNARGHEPALRMPHTQRRNLPRPAPQNLCRDASRGRCAPPRSGVP